MALDVAARFLRRAAWVTLALVLIGWLSGLAHLSGQDPNLYAPESDDAGAYALTAIAFALAVALTAGLLGLAKVLDELDAASRRRTAADRATVAAATRQP